MRFSHMSVCRAITRISSVGIIGGLSACGICAAQTQPPSASARASSTQPASATSKTAFKISSMGELVTGYGIPMGFSYFVAPDGIGLFVLYLRQNDRGHAVEAFKQELARATEITKRRQKKDRNGKVVGERTEILTPSAPPKSPDYAVIWTDGPTFHMIVSSSLQDALGLERVYGY